jgi:hypothetical protein
MSKKEIENLIAELLENERKPYGKFENLEVLNFVERILMERRIHALTKFLNVL